MFQTKKTVKTTFSNLIQLFTNHHDQLILCYNVVTLPCFQFIRTACCKWSHENNKWEESLILWNCKDCHKQSSYHRRDAPWRDWCHLAWFYCILQVFCLFCFYILISHISIHIRACLHTISVLSMLNCFCWIHLNLINLPLISLL